MQIQLINTADGSNTLYIKEYDDHYHSVNGAITESRHVFIDHGYTFHGSSTPVVFEVGFGTGLNCFLTAIEAKINKRPTRYITVEKFPLAKDIYADLNYHKLIPGDHEQLFAKIHDCEWSKEVRISEYFSLLKIEADLLHAELTEMEKCTICYYDAFGPDKQPEMWQPEIMNKLSHLTQPGGVLVTYSAKGEVRRQLQRSGFQMERLPGPPGKKQMLRGIKRESAL